MWPVPVKATPLYVALNDVYAGGGVMHVETPAEQYAGAVHDATVETEHEEFVYVTLFPEQEYSGAHVQLLY